jgi:hypothetical protein
MHMSETPPIHILSLQKLVRLFVTRNHHQNLVLIYFLDYVDISLSTS